MKVKVTEYLIDSVLLALKNKTGVTLAIQLLSKKRDELIDAEILLTDAAKKGIKIKERIIVNDNGWTREFSSWREVREYVNSK